MEPKEIIEGNRLIAEFMGASVKRFVALDKLSVFWPDNHSNRPTYNGAGLETYVYHSSWDWLMPVVEKIEETTFKGLQNEYVPFTDNPFTICFNYKSAKITIDNDFKLHLIHGYGLIFKEHFAETKIQAGWLAVVEFIKWYNQNK